MLFIYGSFTFKESVDGKGFKATGEYKKSSFISSLSVSMGETSSFFISLYQLWVAKRLEDYYKLL